MEALYIFGSNKVSGAIQNQISEKTDRKKEEKMHNTMVNETERDGESQAERRGVDKTPAPQHTQATTTELSLLLAMAVAEAVEWVKKKGARLAKHRD